MTAAVITIAIPYYCGRGLLAEAISSVLAQTSDDWQLVVCDDGGPEPGVDELVRGYGDPRLSYVRYDENVGLAGNWNRCLALATTDLVTLLHYDDRLRPDYVARMAAAAGRHPDAATLHSQAAIIDGNGAPTRTLADAVKRLLRPRGAGDIVLDGRSGVKALMRGDFIVCPTTCYRRSRLPAAPFDGNWKMVLDLDLFVRLLLEGQRLVVLRDVLYEYRRHALNTSGELTKSLVRFEEESALHEEVARAADGRGWTEIAKVARAKRMIKSHLLVRIAQDCYHRRFALAREKARVLSAL